MGVRFRVLDRVEGFEAVEREKPDLIVLDVMMPKRTGFVLFGQLRKSEEYKDIPFKIIRKITYETVAISV